MALTKCKECGHKISKKAESCPNCGYVFKKKSSGLTSGCGCLSISLIVVAVALYAIGLDSYRDYSSREDSSANGNRQPSSAQQRVSDEDCKKSLACWSERYATEAEVYCTRAVENLAQYQARWTDGWLERKFVAKTWNSVDRQFIRYEGNAVQFQNGFGAWRRISYYCVFDPNGPGVLEAGVIE